MRGKIAMSGLVLLLMTAFTVVIAPAASASPSTLTAYEHSNYVNAIQFNQIGSCGRNTISYSLSAWGNGNKMSSVYFGEGASNGCNRLAVRRAARGWPQNISDETWGKCITSSDSGINWFGPGYNDNIYQVIVEFSPYCRPWSWSY